MGRRRGGDPLRRSQPRPERQPAPDRTRPRGDPALSGLAGDSTRDTRSRPTRGRRSSRDLRAIVKKYPTHALMKILDDLVASTPGQRRQVVRRGRRGCRALLTKRSPSPNRTPCDPRITDSWPLATSLPPRIPGSPSRRAGCPRLDRRRLRLRDHGCRRARCPPGTDAARNGWIDETEGESARWSAVRDRPCQGPHRRVASDTNDFAWPSSSIREGCSTTREPPQPSASRITCCSHRQTSLLLACRCNFIARPRAVLHPIFDEMAIFAVPVKITRPETDKRRGVDPSRRDPTHFRGSPYQQTKDPTPIPAPIANQTRRTRSRLALNTS